ncbi:MAG TPA: GNAT family N-acetyltransferase [Paucimonas sp.]|nr:GNAT family N-acetyltransferase [Paucimonas sp.]
MASNADIQSAHYDGEVPPFAEMELERLYGSVYSSLAHFRIHGGAEDASTYVARRGGDIVALFLFRREGRRVRVVNEGMILDREAIENFVEYVFSTFPGVGAIVFHSVQAEFGQCLRPFQRTACGEDIAADLPPTVDEYVARLGSATRKNIRRHKNRLERSFPSFSFRVHTKEEADERQMREIIAFNHARMAAKGKTSVIDEARTQAILRMVRARGFVTVATIDGRVCGGAITARIGDSFISLVNSHDPLYDDYRLGTLCCFLTICACIERGGKRFDFRWGQYEYKIALLGEHHWLYRLILYRSHFHLACNADLAVRTALAGALRAAKWRLAEAANREEGKAGGWIGRSVRWVRAVKRRFAWPAPNAGTH